MDEIPYKENINTGTDSHKQSSYATGKEEEKLKNLILSHVEKTIVNDMFAVMGGESYMIDSVGAEACRILSFIDDALKQESLLNELIKMLYPGRSRLEEIDKTITEVIIYTEQQGTISLLLACQVLVSSIDFTFTMPFYQKKVEYVRERMHLLDYKNMRDLLKLLLVEKLDKLPGSLSEYQYKKLAPIEELMVDLIDRKTNYCPALFFITEISRIQPQSPIHYLPRLSLKIRQMVASFRPLAEIGSMIGRSWMYPITTQLSFSWHYNTWSTWKLQEQTYRLYFKTHLPYSNENSAPQTYLQYILLKQPRGQENLLHIIKSSSNHGGPSRLQCSEVVQILILEAMCAMEETEEAVLTSNNQYNWLHLCHLITYALSVGCCTLQQLLPMLQIQLKNYQYNKAKGELMWILLQFVSTVRTRATTSGKNQLDAKSRDLVLDIFNVLYPEEMVWAGCSDDYPNMVRFFAPASLWINLSHISGSNSVPPPKIQQHIEFFKTRLKPNLILDNGVLAIIANAYSNNQEIFETYVLRTILKMLGGSVDSNHFASLPRGRRVAGCLKALDLDLLDVLTFHAKKMLCNSMLACTLPHVQPGLLPSPALIESICRIYLTTDSDNGRSLAHFFMQICKDRNLDTVAILAEMLNYRLLGMPCNLVYRSYFIHAAVELMSHVSMIGTSQHRALYVRLEQVIMRQMLVASSLDCTSLVTQLSMKNVNFFVPPEKFGLYSEVGLHTCPEIIRMVLLNLFRVQKIIASPTYSNADINFDFLKLAGDSYRWSNSTLKWLAVQLSTKNDSAEALATVQRYDVESEEEMRCFVTTNDDMPVANYQKATLFISIFKSFYLQPSVPPSLPIQCYKLEILNSMSSTDMVINTNAFVDFIVWKSQSLGDNDYDNMVVFVNELIFVKNVLPFERFLLALVLRPSDDTSVEHALLLLSNLINKNSQLAQQINIYTSFAPSHANAAYAMSEHYFSKMMEYYRWYPEKSYVELMRQHGLPDNCQEPEKHLPIYYDCMLERILPVVDVLLQRSLEIAINPDILSIFLKTFSPLYKCHPQPMTFLYKTLYSLDSLGTFTLTPIAKQFVMEIVEKIDDARNPKYIVLSQNFYMHGHDMPVFKFCQALVDRIIATSTYLHQPPSFVACDWRFAEYPPAAQALTGAWIELMASTYSAKDITNGIVELAMRRPINRPYDTINAVGLLLTGLPQSFQNVFFDRLVESFDMPQLLTDEPSMLFEPLSEEVYLYSENRVLSMLAIVHSFCQHAGNSSLSFIPDLIANQLAPKVQNETQLMYFLRILVPYLQRINDKEKQRHIDEYTKPILSIYNVLDRLVQQTGSLQYEDTICDLLYQFKYMFVGYTLKDSIEKIITNFSPSMREKLKFLFTHSSIADQAQETHHHSHRHVMLSAGQTQQLLRQQQQLVDPLTGAIPSSSMYLAGMLGNVDMTIHSRQHPAMAQHGFHTLPTNIAIPAGAAALATAPTSNPFAQPSAITAPSDVMAHPMTQQQPNPMLNVGFNRGVSNPFGEQAVTAPTVYGNSAVPVVIPPAGVPLVPPSKVPLTTMNSIPPQKSNVSDLPPPPPYSQLTPSLSSVPGAQPQSNAGAPVSTAFSMMMNVGNPTGVVQVTSSTAGMTAAASTFGLATSDGSEFGFMPNAMHNVNMSSQQQQQFHHQQQLIQQQMHNNNSNHITTANFMPNGINFPPSTMPPQAFMPPAGGHMAPTGGHMAPTGGMPPHMAMHPGMLAQQQEAFQRQQMARNFPLNNHMM